MGGNVKNSIWYWLYNVTAYAWVLSDTFSLQEDIATFILFSKAKSQEFLNGVGPALQSALIKKSWLSSNYTTDWWEEFVYLRSRDSLLINNNYFGLGFYSIPSDRQTSRIAGSVWAVLKWRKDALIDNKVPPMKL